MKGVISIGLIAVIVILLGAMYFINPNLQGSLTGFSTLSLSTATFQSSSDFWTGNTYILNVVQGGLGQSASGIIHKQDVSSQTGKSPENDLFIRIDYSTQSCEYKMIKSSSAMTVKRLMTPVYWSCLLNPSETDAQTHCPTDMLYYGKFGASFECWCLSSSDSIGYPIANIENPYVHTISTVNVEAKGEKYSQTFDTNGQLKNYVGNNVYVSWNGYLGTGIPCSSQAPYVGIYKGSWQIGDVNYYNSYKTNYLILDSKVGAGVSKTELLNLIGNVNSEANKVLNPVSTFGAIQTVSSSQGLVISDLSQYVQIPMFTFYVKADWLGIVQPIGRPDILSVDAPAFATTGIATVKVKNVGGETENFNVWVTCNRIAGTPTITKTVNKDSTVDFQIILSADTGSSFTDTCTAHAKGVQYEDTFGFTITVNPEKVCQAGKYSCEGNYVKKCNIYGSNFDITEQCDPVTEICAFKEDGTTYCKLINSVCAQNGEQYSLLKNCCSGLCQKNGVCGQCWDWARILTLIVTYFIVGIILYVLLYVLTMFVPMLRMFNKRLMNIQVFGVFILVVMLMMFVFFSGLV